MKFQCQHCHEISSVSDQELPIRTVEKVVKEKCQCGMTEEHRGWRLVAIFASIAFVIGMATLGSCEYIELEKIKTLKDSTKFDVKSSINSGKLIVVPHEEKK